MSDAPQDISDAAQDDVSAAGFAPDAAAVPGAIPPSRAAAAAQAREAETARQAAQARAQEQARLEALKSTGRHCMNLARFAVHEVRLDAAALLNSLRRQLPQATVSPQASPEVVFRPTQP